MELLQYIRCCMLAYTATYAKMQSDVLNMIHGVKLIPASYHSSQSMLSFDSRVLGCGHLVLFALLPTLAFWLYIPTVKKTYCKSRQVFSEL